MSRYGAHPAGVWVALAMLGAASLAPVAAADAPQKAGRYTLTPIDGGVIKLDTDTGLITRCKTKGADLACESVPDAGHDLVQEIERLKAENTQLKAEITRLDNALGVGATKPGSEPDAGVEQRPGGPSAGIPTEKDIDQAFDYASRMFKKFRDKMREFDKKDDTPL